MGEWVDDTPDIVQETYTEEEKKDPWGLKLLKELEDMLGPRTSSADLPEPPMVKRDAWGAVPAKETSEIYSPIQAVFFTDTGTELCHSKEECIPWLQAKQKTDMEDEEMEDIQFNFYIGGDGTVYEGRGWKFNATKTDDNASSMEGLSLDIAYIGDYEDKEIPEDLIKVGIDLIKYAKEAKFMHPHFGINTYWEDHVYGLADKPNSYNPLDDPEYIEMHKEANIPL